MHTSQTLVGSCLCDAVSYRLSAHYKAFYFCHCKQCRKLTGSSFASNILSEPSEVTWTKGADRVKRFDFAGQGAYTHVFCKQCGSALPFLNESGSTLFIPAGSVDTKIEFSPTNNIFWGERAAWLEPGLASEKCTRFVD